MTASTLIAVAGPSGSGKTTWISQFWQDDARPQFYMCPGLGRGSVDLARMGYRFPQVQIVPEKQIQSVLSDLPDEARVYIELGFHLNLESPFLSAMPCRHVAVLPPQMQDSDWLAWADEVVPGNDIASPAGAKLPELWCTQLTGQVFDPPSLDEILIELTEGAYGKVYRAKGIFEMPDGRAFHIDWVEGLPGIEYTELTIPRWLKGRPERFSGLEVVGWNLEQEGIAQVLADGCLSDEAVAQYQQHYRRHHPVEEALVG